MKVFLVLLLVAAVGYFSWRINKKQRAKYAERKTLHKISVKPSNAVKPTELQKEMDRLKVQMDKAKEENDPMSFIKYEDESKIKN